MLASERKCRISSHKARAKAVCVSIKSKRGHVRDSEGKVFSGKISIVTRWAKTEYAILDFRSNRDSAPGTMIDSEGRVLFVVLSLPLTPNWRYSASRSYRPVRRERTRRHPPGHPCRTGRSSEHPKYRGCRSPAWRGRPQERVPAWL